MIDPIAKYKRHRQIAEINVVPYIDVMLVLLVIFMITAPLLFQGVEVNLPKATAKPMEQKQQEPIILSVNSQGNYYLNIASRPTQIIAATDVFKLVQEELKSPTKADRQTLIKGDKNISYEKIIAAMTLLQKAGARSIGLITDPS
jgi:biopolymer transport protein TolR